MRTDPPTGDELARLLVSMKRNVLDQAAHERPVTPTRPQLTDRVLGAILAVALLLGLGTAAALAFSTPPLPLGSQTEPTPTASPTPTPPPRTEYSVQTATPTPTPPADPLAAVTTIVVRPERLDLQDAAGAIVLELSYDEDTAQFVSVLSAVLDSDPNVEEFFSGSEPAARIYTWSGLTVSDYLLTGPGEDDMNVRVVFDQPTLGDGVAVATVAGFRPGDDLAAFASSVGAAYYLDYGENLIPLETGPELGPSPTHRVNAHAVVASDWGRISEGPSKVFAPFNFGREQGAG